MSEFWENHWITHLLPLCSWARGLLIMYTKSRWKKRKEKFLTENHQLPKARILTINSKLYPHQMTLLHEEQSIKFSLTFSLNVKLTSCLQYLQWYSYNTILFKQRPCLELQRVIKQYINETDKPKTQRSIFSADLPTQSWHCSRDVGQCNEDHRKTSQPFIFLQKCVVGNPSQRQVTVISWSSYYMDC